MVTFQKNSENPNNKKTMVTFQKIQIIQENYRDPSKKWRKLKKTIVTPQKIQKIRKIQENYR